MHSYRTLPRRAGFTLVELLVAIAVLLVLTTMSVAVYNLNASSDRIRSSARQVQSSFGGARDRTIKSARKNKLSVRGLRLLVDAQNPSTVTSMVYVGTDGPWTDGCVTVGRLDDDNDGQADSPTVNVVRGWPKYDVNTRTFTPTGWKNLYDQGLLVDGSRIRIPAGDAGTWYTVQTYPRLANHSGHGPEILVLTSEYRGTATVTYPTLPTMTDGQPGHNDPAIGRVDDDQDEVDNNPEELGAPGDTSDITDINAISGNAPSTYELELKPTVLPGQEPMRLSSGIAIDLFHSRIPTSWYSERSLPKGTALPPADQGWSPTPNPGSYYVNGWGVWSVQGTDPNNTANDIYRQYSPRMDVMFSPQGSVSGPLGTLGMIHLRLADLVDIGERRDPAHKEASPMLYSTLFTQTGYVATFPVNVTDTNNDGVADDPLYFARIGGTAGK